MNQFGYYVVFLLKVILIVIKTRGLFTYTTSPPPRTQLHTPQFLNAENTSAVASETPRSITKSGVGPFELGPCVALDPQRDDYLYQHAGIQKASRTLREPQCAPVEYSLRWKCEGLDSRRACQLHVNCMLFV